MLKVYGRTQQQSLRTIAGLVAAVFTTLLDMNGHEGRRAAAIQPTLAERGLTSAKLGVRGGQGGWGRQPAVLSPVAGP